jgi:hypothetical protein
MIPAEFDDVPAAIIPIESVTRTRRPGEVKARQDIERVSALLRAQAPELVAHDTLLPASREAEPRSARWPMIAAFGMCGLAWIALAVWLLD